MELAGCFNGKRTCYISKDQGKFDFSWYLMFHSQNHIMLFYSFQPFYKNIHIHPQYFVIILITECETAFNHIVLL